MQLGGPEQEMENQNITGAAPLIFLGPQAFFGAKFGFFLVKSCSSNILSRWGSNSGNSEPFLRENLDFSLSKAAPQISLTGRAGI